MLILLMKNMNIFTLRRCLAWLIFPLLLVACVEDGTTYDDVDENYVIGPGEVNIRQGEEVTLGIFNDGVQDFGAYLGDDRSDFEVDQYEWTIEPQHLAVLTQQAGFETQLVARVPGTVTITASNSQRTLSKTLTLQPALLKSLTISPSEGSFYSGLSRQLQAIGHYSDGSVKVLTTEVSWSHNSEGITSISVGGVLQSRTPSQFSITASINDELLALVTHSVNFTVTEPAMASLNINGQVTLPLGRSSQLNATGHYTDLSNKQIASEVTWNVTGAPIITINSEGILQTVAEGSTTVTASHDNGYGTQVTSSNMAVTVEAKVLDSMEVAPDDNSIDALQPIIAVDKSPLFKVTGVYSNGDRQPFVDADDAVNWSSSDETVASIASIANEQDEYKATINTHLVGDTIIKSEKENRYGQIISGQLSLAVNRPPLISIAISWQEEEFAKGEQAELLAQGLYEDGSIKDISDQVTWSSADTALLTFPNNEQVNLASAVAAGNTSISASLTNKEGVLITSPAFSVEVVPPVIYQARIDSLKDGLLSDNQLVIAQGLGNPLVFTAIYTDQTEQAFQSVNWQSSDALLGAVDNSSGLLSAIDVGQVVIEAQVSVNGLNFQKQIAVEVTPAMLTNLKIELNGETGFWKGLQQTFIASGSFSNGLEKDLTADVTWSIEPAYETQVSQLPDTPHILQLIEQGSAGIKAVYLDQYNDSKETLVSFPFDVKAALLTSLNVTAKIDLIENVTEVANGKEVQFQAFGTYTDDTTLELTTQVTWLTNPVGKLQVDSSGLGTGLATSSGSDNLRIIARKTNVNNDEITYELPFTVTPATLLSIRLVQDVGGYGEQIPAGASSQINAVGYFSDKKEYPISALTWDSLDTTAALVNVTGVVTSEKNVVGVPFEPGEAGNSKEFYIRAVESLSGERHSAQIKLYTAAPVVESIRIDPDTSVLAYEIANGSELYVRAYSVYSDDHEKEITKSAGTSWSVPDAAHASYISVNNSTNFKGLVTGLIELPDGENPLEINVQTTNSRSQLISNNAQVIVGAAQLDFIEITPPRPSMVEGDSLSFTATGFLTNNTSEDYTDKVTWSSQREVVAAFDTTQLNKIKASSVGNTNVYASFTSSKGKTVTDSTLLEVEAKSLRELTLSSNITRITQDTPPRHLFLLGLTDTLKANGVYSNATNADLSQQVTWTSSDASVASVNNTDNKGALQPLTVGTTTITAQQSIVELGESKVISVEFLVTVGVPLLQYLEITPPSPTVTQGVRQNLTATGIYSDNSTKNLTTQVAWSTGSNSAEPEADKVGIVTSAGIFTAQKGGQIFVNAKLENIDGEMITGKTFATVAELNSIDIEQSATNVYLGQNLNLTAYGVVAGGSRVTFEEDLTWHSSDTSIALLANSAGGSENVLEAKKEGAVTITATKAINNKPSIVGSLVLVVKPALLASVNISASTSSAAKGMTWQFSAQGEYSDNTSKDIANSVTWLSQDVGVATMASGGIFKGIDEGSVIIQAKVNNAESQEKLSNSYPFTVTASVLKAISMTPATVSIPAGLTSNLLVAGTLTDNNPQASVTSPEIVFTSSNPSIASVDQTGLVTTHTMGSATITANKPAVLTTSSGDITIQDSTAITVTAAEINQLTIVGGTSLADGQSLQFSVQALKSDGSAYTPITPSDVTWFSDNTNVAFINSNGLLEARSAGDARIQISKTSPSGLLISSAVEVTVTPPVLESIVITPSTDPDFVGVQVVDYKGHNIRLKAYGIDSVNAKVILSEGIVWNSSNSSVVLLDDQAIGDEVLSELKATGTVTVTASKTVAGQGTIVGSVSVNVQAALLEKISITADMASAPKGLTRQYNATGEYSDNSTQDITANVTWLSQSVSLATIASGGQLTALQVGTVNIQAKQTNAKSVEVISDSSAFEIQSPVLKAMAMTPSSATVPKGLTKSFQVSGTNTDDSSVASVTSPEITWSSSNESLATVDQQGVVTSVAMGSVTITATKSGTLYKDGSNLVVNASQVLTITAAELNGLTITGGDTSLANGQELQFSVTGKNSDDTDFTPLTSSDVTWFSSDTNVAVISASGYLETRSEGTVDIQITKNSLSGLTINNTITVTVSAPILESIVIKPASDPSFSGAHVVGYKGHNIRFNAHGIDTIGDTVTLSDGITWASSDTSVALMNSAVTDGQGSGELKNDHASTVSVSASKTIASGTVTGSILLKVEPALLESITISTNIESAANGLSRQFSAQGGYSDNTSGDITNSVTWLSDNETLASISSAGVLTTKALGTLNVSAKKTNVNSAEIVSAATSFEVQAAVLKAITVSPATVSVAHGLSHSFTVSGTNTDDTAVASVTSPEISFSSSDETVATVDASGLVTTLKEGVTTIKASKAGVLATLAGDVVVENTSVLTVIAPELNGLSIVEGDSTTHNGQSVQFSVSATNSDGAANASVNAASVAWSSSQAGIVTISDSGLLTAVGVGQTVITISKDSLSGQTITGTITVTVSAAVLKAIAITPGTASVPAGLTQSFTVSGTNTDDSAVASVTNPEITFTSSDETVATVDQTGLVTTLKAGTTNIKAAKAGVLTTISGDVTVESTSVLTVTAVELNALSITQGDSSIAKGNSLQLSISGTNSDASAFTPLALTDVTWTSSTPAVVSVSASGLLQSLTEGTSTIQISETSSSGRTITGSIEVTVTAAILKSITLSSDTSFVYASNTAQFTASGTYTDGTTVDPLIDQFTWTVSDSDVAGISTAGLVTSKAAGLVSIGATPTDNTVSVTTGSLTVVAIPASIVLIAGNSSIAKGNFTNVTAKGDSVTIALGDLTWTSDSSSLSVDDAGKVTGLAVGNGNITATLKVNGVSKPVGTVAVTVTAAELVGFAVYPHASTVLAKASTLKVSPVGIYSDHSTAPYTGAVTWTTPAASTITVNGNDATAGESANSIVTLTTTTAQSAQTITAAPSGGLSTQTFAVTFLDAVLASVEILPEKITAADKTKLTLLSTALFADDTVQAGDTATLSTGGSSTIVGSVATLQDVADPGVSETFTSSVTVGGITKTASQAVDIENAATVTSGVIGDLDLVALEVYPRNPSVAAGLKQSFKAFATFEYDTSGTTKYLVINVSDDVAWKLDTVAQASGEITFSSSATGVVTATYDSKTATSTATVKSTIISLELTSDYTNVPKSVANRINQQKVTALAVFSDASKQVISEQVLWSLDNESVATISNQQGSHGTVTAGTTAGSIVVTAKLWTSLGELNTTHDMTVDDCTLTTINITPSTNTLGNSMSYQYKANGVFDSCDNRDITDEVTWSFNKASGQVSNAVGNSGRFYSLLTAADGILTATMPHSGVSNITDTSAVTRENVAISSLTITSSVTEIAENTSASFTVDGVFNQNSVDMTQDVVWISSDSSKVFISNAPGSKGVATRLTTGDVKISAYFEAESKQVSVGTAP